MRSLIVFIAALFVSANSMTLQEHKQMMVGIAQECKASEGASDKDMSLLILKKPLSSPEGKCMYACIMENLGVIKDDKISMPDFMEFLSTQLNGDAKAIATVTEIANGCKDVSDPDRCEFASKAAACIKAGTTKAKIDIGM